MSATLRLADRYTFGRIIGCNNIEFEVCSTNTRLISFFHERKQKCLAFFFSCLPSVAECNARYIYTVSLWSWLHAISSFLFQFNYALFDVQPHTFTIYVRTMNKHIQLATHVPYTRSLIRSPPVFKALMARQINEQVILVQS